MSDPITIVITEPITEIIEVGTPGPAGATGADGADGAPGADGADGIMSFPLKAPVTGHTDPPSYGFTGGDDDTGVYSPAPGYVAVLADGERKVEFSENLSELFGDVNIVSGNLDVGGNLTADNYPLTGPANVFVYFDQDGNVNPAYVLAINGNGDGGVAFFKDISVDNQAAFREVHSIAANYSPLQNSPNDTRALTNLYMNIDPDSDGFQMGTNGQGFILQNMGITHNGTSDVGELSVSRMGYSVGNGTDPISVRGFAGHAVFGQFYSGVTINNYINGYIMSTNMEDGVETSSSGATIFGDYNNWDVDFDGSYEGVHLGPQLRKMLTNHNFTGIQINPQIQELEGNTGFFGVAMSPFVGAAGTGDMYGMHFNPQSGSKAHSAFGLWISMDNVDVYAGLQESAVIQDLTYTFNLPGINGIQIEYVDDGTAGAETAVIAGNTVTVHMDAGVSTALQIKAAVEANFSIASNLTVTVSGTGSNTQSAQALTGFTGGAYPGQKKAAYFDGDVEITGSLTFGGNLSIGGLNAFAVNALSDSSGAPASGHSLITQWTCPDNSTIANADTLGVNTAALIVLGANSTITTSFLGVTALGLPAVAGLGANTTVDRIGGAAFALSLDAGAGAGSEIDIVSLCRGLAIPNGITQVNRLYGYEFSLPFGDPGTLTWSFYSDVADAVFYNNGAVKVGGADLPTNSSVGLEIESSTMAFLNARMNQTARDALTAVNGMQIYNETTDKLQVYAAGAWTDLH